MATDFGSSWFTPTAVAASSSSRNERSSEGPHEGEEARDPRPRREDAGVDVAIRHAREHHGRACVEPRACDAEDGAAHLAPCDEAERSRREPCKRAKRAWPRGARRDDEATVVDGDSEERARVAPRVRDDARDLLSDRGAELARDRRRLLAREAARHEDDRAGQLECLADLDARDLLLGGEASVELAEQ